MVGPTNLKPRAGEVLRDRARHRRLGRHLLDGAEIVDLRFAVEKIPQELREARTLFHDLEPRARRAHGAFDLQAIAHDAGILHQRLDLLRRVARDLLRRETVEGLAEIVALAQDRDPGQPGLETVEDELFEQRAVVEFRHAPFVIVIGDVERIVLRPRAALQAVGMFESMSSFGGLRLRPATGNAPSAGFTGRIAMPPAIIGVPFAIASATRSSRSVASPRPIGRADPICRACCLAGHHRDARFRRRTVEGDRHDAGARGAAMLHARHDLLADEAALVEIDAAELVHVGFVRETRRCR